MAKARSIKRASELRQRAEKILAQDPQAIRSMATTDIQKLIHELNVHQIELEMQNEEFRHIQLELQETRDKYVDLYDFAPTGYFTLDRNSLIVDVNLAGSELLGSEKHRLIGAQFTAYISPDSQDAFHFHYREVLKTGIKGDCELKMLKADGTPFHAQLISMAVPEKDGNISQCRAAVIDITERKKAKEKLRESEEFSSSLLANSPNPVIVINADNSLRYVNPALENLTGFTSTELMGRGIPYPWWPEEAQEEISKDFKALLYTGSWQFERLFQKKDGTRFWVEVSGIPVIHSGEFKYRLTNWVDITERKRAEEELRRLNEWLRRIFESVTDGIRVVDLNGTIVEANQRMLEIHGVSSKDEILGKSAFRFFTPHEHERVKVNMRKTLEGETIRDVEYSLLKADGSKFPAEINASVLKDASGKPIGFITTTRDITERKLMSLKLEEQNKELLFQNEEKEKRAAELVVANKELLFQNEEKEKRAAELVVANKELLFQNEERKKMQEQLIITDRLASIGQLTAGIAHELNNPLTSVIGFSDLLMGKDLPEDVKEDLAIISREAMRTANVVKGLLAFSRKQGTEKEPVDINSTIQDVLQIRSYEQRLSNIEVNTRYAPELPEVIGNRGQLQQVFINIIINAEQAMVEACGRGTLTITTEQAEDMVLASFTDDGPGISPENMRKLFTPFFTTKGVGKGTGLGLSICHGIVAEHGGRIYARSELGKGASFILELPILVRGGELNGKP